jgi:C4-type Zn-finger protein
LDGNEIAARLHNLRGARTDCPMCGSTKWANHPTGEPASIPIGGNVGIEVVGLFCDGCGFVRYHLAERLHD